MARYWGIRIDQHPGPWMSLGVHIDLGSPLIDLHLIWWLISVGRIYPGGRWEFVRDRHQRPVPLDWDF